jgi:hypothetical protein
MVYLFLPMSFSHVSTLRFKVYLVLLQPLFPKTLRTADGAVLSVATACKLQVYCLQGDQAMFKIHGDIFACPPNGCSLAKLCFFLWGAASQNSM